MKKIALIAFFAVTTANAGTPVKSEFFYQTEATQHQVTPELSYDTQNVEFTNSKSDVTGQTLSVRYEYGINEMLSTGILAGYLTGEEEAGTTTTDQKGMTDITLFLKGQNAFADSQSMHWGADLDWSPGDREINNTTNEVNAMTGGLTIKPFVGYVWMTGPGLAGINFNTALGLGDRTLMTTTGATETESKLTNGLESALTGFYEHTMDKTIIGTSLSYVNIATTDIKTGTSETTRDGGNLWRLRVYPRFQVSETTTILGELSYSTLVSKNATYDSYNLLTAQVGGRFTF